MKEEVTWSDFLGIDVGLTENSCLANVNPGLAKEWHPTKNGKLTPFDVTCGSGKRVWWKCEEGHEWKTTVASRNNGCGCAYCKNLKVFEPVSYEEAKKIVHSLKLSSIQEWYKYCKGECLPKGIPVSPKSFYKNQWVSWGDFLGTKRVANQNRKFVTFNDAKRFLIKNNIKSKTDFEKWKKTSDRPTNIPSMPRRTYKKEWKGWGDFLETGNVNKKEFLPYKDAKKYMSNINLKSTIEWRKWVNDGLKPRNIPSSPSESYGEDWVNWGDFLGTNFINYADRKYKSYKDARKYVHQLNLKKYDEWVDYCKNHTLPDGIPITPRYIYKNKGWVSVQDWLGYSKLGNCKDFASFEEAKKFAKLARIKTLREWASHRKKNGMPSRIPSNPQIVYKKEWKGWKDFLGN